MAWRIDCLLIGWFFTHIALARLCYSDVVMWFHCESFSLYKLKVKIVFKCCVTLLVCTITSNCNHCHCYYQLNFVEREIQFNREMIFFNLLMFSIKLFCLFNFFGSSWCSPGLFCTKLLFIFFTFWTFIHEIRKSLRLLLTRSLVRVSFINAWVTPLFTNRTLEYELYWRLFFRQTNIVVWELFHNFNEKDPVLKVFYVSLW